MSEPTALDRAHAAMSADPDDDTSRLRFLERLADSELFLMLKQSVVHDDDTILPEVFDLGDTKYVLVFDREERLSAFAGQTTPFVALSGRALAAMLKGQEIGLGVNLDVAPSSILLPHEAVEWLETTLGNSPDKIESRIEHLYPPHGLPEQFVQALDAKLATAMGLADSAYLVGVTYEGARKGHLLGFVDALEAAEDALAQAAAETLTFSGIEAGVMDVGFFRSDDEMAQKLERVGLRFELPQIQAPVTKSPVAPGMDPEKPPKLK